MNKLYELTILAGDDLAKDEAMQYAEELLQGSDYKIEYGGCKTLYYPVDGHEKAHYIYVDIVLSPLEARLLPEKLEKLDWCLRYLCVVEATRAEKIKGIIKEYIIDTLGREELNNMKLDIEGLAYKIDNKLGEEK